MAKVPGRLLSRKRSRLQLRQLAPNHPALRGSGAASLETWVSSSRVQRGLKSQDIVATYFATNGWPYALPAGSGRQGTDVTGVPGVDIEVKARRGINVAMAMRQLRERRQEGVLPVAVLRLDGQGESHIADWPAILPLSVLLDLLKAAGYDKPKLD